MANETTVVLVHGAWHDETCWDLVRTNLSERNIPSVAVRLPMTTLDADAEVVRASIEELVGEVVVVAHSWGGSPVTLGASGLSRVKHLIYLAAYMIEAGLPAMPVELRTPTTGIRALVNQGDQVIIDTTLAKDVFYHDVDSHLTAAMIAKLRPFATTGLLPVLTDRIAAWRTTPTTYAVCLQDRSIHPKDQRIMAKNADEVVEFDASHSPFLSKPDLVADLIAQRYEQVVTAATADH